MSGRRRQTRDETERARQLRATSTKPESILWSALRNRGVAGLKFRRQVPIGPFIADFVCAEANLIVELDGASHDGREAYDGRRTRHLESLHFRVVRVTNDDVIEDVESVAIAITRAAGIDVVAWLNGRLNNPIKTTESDSK